MPERERQPRRRAAIAALLSVLLSAIYFALPGGGDDSPSVKDGKAADFSDEPQALEILEVFPHEPAPGGAIFVRYDGPDEVKRVSVLGAKRELRVLAQLPQLAVAEVPSDQPSGRLKLRVSSGEGRSRAYQLTIRPIDWREKFRDLLGGIAILALAISLLTRGLRETVGAQSSERLARFMRHPASALGLGGVLGALSQSTAAVIGLLAGLVSSNVLGVGAAGAAFLGAQLGSAVAPSLAIGWAGPREGLLVVALAMIWSVSVQGRRARAFTRVVLGVGLIGVALWILRPSVEPLLASGRFLSFMAELRADHAAGIVSSALLGALLVLILQGPAPVLLLVLAIARTTGHVDLPTALAIMSGSGLGSAVGALLTTPVGERSRRLAELNLLLGGASTLVAAVGVHLWSKLAVTILDGVIGSPAEPGWPDAGAALVVGFVASQIVIALMLLPLLAPLGTAIEAMHSARSEPRPLPFAELVVVILGSLSEALSAQRRGLGELSRLTLASQRRGGRDAERLLVESAEILESALSLVSKRTRPTRSQFALSSMLSSCLQLQRGLEELLSRAERLTDERLARAARPGSLASLTPEEDQLLEGMQALTVAGLADLESSLEAGAALDLQEARAREIRMNGLESTARDSLPAGGGDSERMRVCLAVLAVVDAYEVVGNHVYRMAERLGQTYLPESVPRSAPWVASLSMRSRSEVK